MFDLSLYLVTNSGLCGERRLEDIVEAAVQGGCTMVQLREKDLDTGTFIARARILKKVLAPYHVPLIINDRVDVALAADADGVHLGQSDMSIADARRLVGNKIIGWSVESMDDVRRANELDVDYIGISPVFATPTKTDTAQPFGIEGTRQAAAISKHPAVGIGGINRNTIDSLRNCGLAGVAVVSDIMLADDPRMVAHVLLSKMQER
ncbi:MAG: thiamine phosphate synthase [Paludibacteraceae bacterium]|nr:thiamine phosphate synthase [Paludibacteraceae bacterium]